MIVPACFTAIPLLSPYNNYLSKGNSVTVTSIIYTIKYTHLGQLNHLLEGGWKFLFQPPSLVIAENLGHQTLNQLLLELRIISDSVVVFDVVDCIR